MLLRIWCKEGLVTMEDGYFNSAVLVARICEGGALVEQTQGLEANAIDNVGDVGAGHVLGVVSKKGVLDVVVVSHYIL